LALSLQLFLALFLFHLHNLLEHKWPIRRFAKPKQSFLTPKNNHQCEATRLPEFRYDLSDKKFNAHLTAGMFLVKQFAKVEYCQ